MCRRVLFDIIEVAYDAAVGIFQLAYLPPNSPSATKVSGEGRRLTCRIKRKINMKIMEISSFSCWQHSGLLLLMKIPASHH